MTSPSVVRLATEADQDQLMHLGRLLHEENGLFPMDDDLCLEIIQKALRHEGSIIGVIGPSDSLEGMICMEITNFWYSRKPHLVELFNFVHPDHRRSNHAKALLSFAKQCATDDVKLLIGVFSNEKTQAKVRLYERQFGKPAGAFFVYPPQAAAQQDK